MEFSVPGKCKDYDPKVDDLFHAVECQSKYTVGDRHFTLFYFAEKLRKNIFNPILISDQISFYKL